MHFQLFLFAEFLLFLNLTCASDDESCFLVESQCAEQKTCRDCIRAHYCCEWCYENLNSSRCITKDTSQKCNEKFLETNNQSTWEMVKNSNFTDVLEAVSEAIQFKAQEYNLKLRYGEPLNISISYRPAKDYPLDLYYLMDLTRSMKPDLETLTTLGADLTDVLQNLTRNHHIAFGSYIDKPEMPFFLTDSTNQNNPCSIQSEICEKGYLFRHRLNFTNDINTFLSEVEKSDLSANVDDPEGGMDAVMQIALCGLQLGWSRNSRKLILMATEGTVHFAGDGLLAGYTKRNTQQCFIDSTGNYMSLFEKNDYPSLEEVYNKLKKQKINIIVAAKSNVNNYYQNMAELIDDIMFVGELEKNSKNVLTLVKKGYEAFLKKVHLSATQIDGLDVDFYADCNGDDKWEKTASCNDAKEGKEIHFKIQFHLNKHPTSDSEVLYIEEDNIQENIKINVEFVGSHCKCNSLEQQNITERINDTECHHHGEFSCGTCLCKDGWDGNECEKECLNNYNECRYVDDDGIISLTCSGRGECKCSKCECNSNQYQGKFCEFECPFNRITKQVCGGNGVCKNGTCECYDNYSGLDCSCHETNQDCIIPGTDDNICNKKGFCKCGRCDCRLNGYTGEFCEICDRCNGLCDHYEPFVSNISKHENVHIEIVQQLEQEKCIYQFKNEDEKGCTIYYSYTISKNTAHIIATQAQCTTPISAGIWSGLIIGTFIALILLIIIIWKGSNMYLDRKEYNQFCKNKEMSSHREENPLYKDPIIRYENPIKKNSLSME